MGNVFPANKDIHQVYDLKGSLFGRMLPAGEVSGNPRAVMKDLNWIASGHTLQLGPEKAQLLCMQLDRDVQFLMRHGVMDFSLLGKPGLFWQFI